MSCGPVLGTALHGPPDMDSFRQQLEEAMALSAIYEDDFRVYSLQQQQQQQQPQQQESSVDKSPTTDAPAADACTAGSLGMEEVDPEALLAELDSAGPSDAAAPKTVPLLFEVMVHVELPPQGLQLRLPARGGSGSAAAKGGVDSGDGGGGGGGGAGADAGGVDTPAEGRTIAAGDPVRLWRPGPGAACSCQCLWGLAAAVSTGHLLAAAVQPDAYLGAQHGCRQSAWCSSLRDAQLSPRLLFDQVIDINVWLMPPPRWFT